MKDETLLKIAVFTSIGGVIILFFVSQFIANSAYAVSSLNPEQVGQTVKIQGNISSIYISGKGHCFLKVTDETGEITGVLFKDSFAKVEDSFKIGDIVEVSGKLDEYQGELEILVRDINVISA